MQIVTLFGHFRCRDFGK